MSPVGVYRKCAGSNDGDLNVSAFYICGANSYGACKRTCRKILSRAHEMKNVCMSLRRLLKQLIKTMQKRFQTVKFLAGSGNTALCVHVERKAKNH